MRTSEYVALGHPDATADYIGCYILDRLVEQDPFVRCGLEVQFKDNVVNLAGEITSASSQDFRPNLKRWVYEAICEVGYTPEYYKRWGCVTNPDELQVNEFISKQSPDIKVGVDKEGFGDQGIYFGMATPDAEYGYFQKEYYLARKLGQVLYSRARQYEYGIDIKTQVTIDKDWSVKEVVVAVPMQDDKEAVVKDLVNSVIGEKHQLIINGTGAYETHGAVGDAGVLGRKLVVDAYGGGCKIGGGAYWGKDGTKSDLALNIHARALAIEMAKRNGKKAKVSMSTVIGRNEVHISAMSGKEFIDETETIKPSELIGIYDLRKPMFALRKRHGIFDERWF